MSHRTRLVCACLGLAVVAGQGCGPEGSPAPVVVPDNALVGRYFMTVDALGLVFAIDEVRPAGENRYTVVGRATGSLPDVGGDIECAFEQTGVVDHQNVDLIFTPGAGCPPSFGTDPISVRLRLRLSGFATGPDAFRGVPVEAEPY